MGKVERYLLCVVAILLCAGAGVAYYRLVLRTVVLAEARSPSGARIGRVVATGSPAWMRHVDLVIASDADATETRTMLDVEDFLDQPFEDRMPHMVWIDESTVVLFGKDGVGRTGEKTLEVVNESQNAMRECVVEFYFRGERRWYVVDGLEPGERVPVTMPDPTEEIGIGGRFASADPRFQAYTSIRDRRLDDALPLDAGNGVVVRRVND